MRDTAESTLPPGVPSEYVGAPVAAEQVSLEVKYHELEYADRWSQVTAWNWGLIVIVLVLNAALLYVVFRMTSPVFGIAIPIVLLGVIQVWQRARRRFHPQEDRRRFEIRPDARLKAVGRTDELAWLQNLPDVPFEPVIVRWKAGLAGTSTKRGASIFGAIMGLTMMLLMLVLPLSPIVVGLSVGLVVPLVAFALPRFAPTYYRLVPGRLDLIRASPLRHQIEIQNRYDLRTARITVRFDEGTAEITCDAALPLKIVLASLSEPRQFAISLFQAAVSTHPAPALPDDALLG